MTTTKSGPYGMGRTVESEIAVAKELYAQGKLTLSQLERTVSRLLKNGT